MLAQNELPVSPAVSALPCPPWCAEPHVGGDPGLHHSAPISIPGPQQASLQITRLDPEPNCPSQSTELWLQLADASIEVPTAEVRALLGQLRSLVSSVEMLLPLLEAEAGA